MTYWECAETASDSLKCTEMKWSSLHCKMKFREMQTNVQIISNIFENCKKCSVKCTTMCKKLQQFSEMQLVGLLYRDKGAALLQE